MSTETHSKLTVTLKKLSSKKPAVCPFHLIFLVFYETTSPLKYKQTKNWPPTTALCQVHLSPFGQAKSPERHSTEWDGHLQMWEGGKALPASSRTTIFVLLRVPTPAEEAIGCGDHPVSTVTATTLSSHSPTDKGYEERTQLLCLVPV